MYGIVIHSLTSFTSKVEKSVKKLQGRFDESEAKREALEAELKTAKAKSESFSGAAIPIPTNQNQVGILDGYEIYKIYKIYEIYKDIK